LEKDYVKFVESSRCFKTFDEFLEDNPKISPEWREFMEPRIQKAERDMIVYLLGVIRG
jgi:hypothetical protein